MPDLTTFFDETLDAWEYARRGFIAEAENIPAGDWGFRPTPENRDVSELVLHILQAAGMAIGELTRPDGDFTRQSFADHIQEHAGHLPETAAPGAWLDLLRTQLDDGLRRLREAGPERLGQPITQFNGEPALRLSWFHHHVAHEEYHRGQLTLYARLTGQVPALTQRMQAGG
ncbi:MAG: DinB family protein [Longimicrobiales bacterium]|nr:DinB family protein [Longimicrobiales bacterium]